MLSLEEETQVVSEGERSPRFYSKDSMQRQQAEEAFSRS